MLKQYMEEKAAKIDAALADYLPGKDRRPARIHRAMRYSVLAGGKRLRPILVMAAAELNGLDEDRVMPSAVAIECIHSYSLIHDDLPCMDDDEYRRGQLANHRVFGEGLAVLAGDALLTLAFLLLAENRRERGVDESSVLQVISEVSEAAGTGGLIGGQVADLESEGCRVSEDTLDFIHRHKTAALLWVSLRTGAILAGAESIKLNALSEYGQHLGLAFQITDDILDVVGESSLLGKETGSDYRKKKATYPALHGLAESKAQAQKEVKRAHEALAVYGDSAEPLHLLADFILERKY